MVRYSLLLLVGLGCAAPVQASSWADSMFDGLSRDFGSVPRGPVLTHPFRITNKTGGVLQIGQIRVSCGCVTATPTQTQLAPGESAAILVNMDTRRFSGLKTVTLYVPLVQSRYEEVRLWVQANSRDDVMLTPDSLSFGQIKPGAQPAVSTNITLLGNSEWQIVEVHSDSNYVSARLVEVKRENSEVVYQLTGRVRGDTPVGKWYSDLWLKTNNPATPRVRVPVTVEVESALSVSPAALALGEVKAGTVVERKVIVRGNTPFRITAVAGTDTVVAAGISNDESRTVHVLTITLKPVLVGEIDRTLRVLTSLKEEGQVEFQAKATVIP